MNYMVSEVNTSQNEYFLFLDDVRDVGMIYHGFTNNDFVVVRSYAEFVKYISQNGLPQLISFDNDLGEDANGNLLPDGYACAKWLVYKSNLDISNLKYRVHSSNPVAKKQIESLLYNYINHLKNNINV